jgi:hypothetical protein
MGIERPLPYNPNNKLSERLKPSAATPAASEICSLPLDGGELRGDRRGKDKAEGFTKASL